MSTASNSVMQVTSYPESSAVNATLYRADNRTARNPERAETSFLDKIVGRGGSLRSILGQVVPTENCVRGSQRASLWHADRRSHR